MPLAVLTATVGVFLLLLAFALNLIGRMERHALAYHVLNIAGAGLSCFAAVLISFWPFVVLEGCWLIVAGVAMANRLFTKGDTR